MCITENAFPIDVDPISFDVIPSVLTVIRIFYVMYVWPLNIGWLLLPLIE